MSLADFVSRLVPVNYPTGTTYYSQIETALEAIYNGSPTAAAAIDGWLSANPNAGMVISYVKGAADFDPNTGYLEIDPTYFAGNYYISTTGQAVQDTLLSGVAHELSHKITGLPDDDSFTDTLGQNVRNVNTWYGELGISKQSSYEAYDLGGNILSPGYQYTDGSAINNAFIDNTSGYYVYGTIQFSTTNLNLSADGILGNSLIVGSSKDNIFTGNDQSDWIYGGAGDDIISGLAGDDFIYGGLGNDILIGGGGNDDIWGGDKNVDLGSLDGTDTVDYSSGSTPITINYDGTGGAPTIAVDDGMGGIDSLHSIEKIVGTSSKDTFSFKGVIPAGYDLTIDANGGQSSGVADIINTKGSTDLSGMDVNVNKSTGDGYIKSKSGSGGQIILKNFKTQIVGSFYDDTIQDGSSADKTIYGLDGNDSISVEDGNNVLIGGVGDDIINGGSGNDYISAGDGSNTVNGGGGDDYILTSTLSGFESVSAGAGNDYLAASCNLYPSEESPIFGSIVLSGGAGDDVIDTIGSLGGLDSDNFQNLHGLFTIAFGKGDGHDTILSNSEDGYNEGYDSGSLSHDEGHWNVSQIDMSTVSSSDVTYIWEVTDDPTLVSPGTQDWPSYWSFGGDLAIRINSTGDTIFLGYVQGIASGHDDGEWEGYDWSPTDGTDGYKFEVKAPTVLFADDGSPTSGLTFDIGGNADIYNVAPSEYAGPGRDADQSLAGTSGNDAITGGSGNDAISMGDGDDTITASPGTDQVDGGAGSDTFTIFEGLNDFSRALSDGKLVLTSSDGVEGMTTLTGVESVYSVTDGVRYSVADMIGDFGTPDDDVIIGTDASDVITAGDGDDTITPEGGSDTIDGGNGTDQVIYAGSSTDYQISREADDTIDVVISDGSNFKYDELTNIESLYFSGDGATILVSSLPPLDSLNGDGGSSQSTATVMTLDAGSNDNTPALSHRLSGGPAHVLYKAGGMASAGAFGLAEIHKAAAMLTEASVRFGVNASASEWGASGLEAISQYRQHAFARPAHTLV